MGLVILLLRLRLATLFRNSLSKVFPAPFCNSCLQFRFATPFYNFFLQLLFAAPFCSYCLQLHFTAPVCNSVELPLAVPFWNSFWQVPRVIWLSFALFSSCYCCCLLSTCRCRYWFCCRCCCLCHCWLWLAVVCSRGHLGHDRIIVFGGWPLTPSPVDQIVCPAPAWFQKIGSLSPPSTFFSNVHIAACNAWLLHFSSDNAGVFSNPQSGLHKQYHTNHRQPNGKAAANGRNLFQPVCALLLLFRCCCCCCCSCCSCCCCCCCCCCMFLQKENQTKPPSVTRSTCRFFVQCLAFVIGDGDVVALLL